jgi:thiazole synthase
MLLEVNEKKGRNIMEDQLIIGGKEIKSRLFLGTGKFGDDHLIPKCIEASGAQIITVAMRRIDFHTSQENMMQYIPKDCILMPNTSGARNAEEAVRIARLGRAAGCGDWVKIEVVSDNKYLLPDNEETLKAVDTLVKEGFTVLPYMTPDLYAARRMRDSGAAAVMPFGAPIGTNKGLRTREVVQIMAEELDLPVVVDAGIGKPSEAAECMEIGAAAVLVNTAVATAGDPVRMAAAFGKAVQAGREAFLASPGAVRQYAEASSPLTGFLHEA